MERQNSILLENVYKMTTYSSQMQIWKVGNNTGGAMKEHPNTETWRVKKNDRSCVSFVPSCCNHPFSDFPFESLWSDHRRRMQKIWTDERQQPIWWPMQKETLPGLSMWDNLGQQSYKKERRACGQKRSGTGHREIRQRSSSVSLRVKQVPSA